MKKTKTTSKKATPRDDTDGTFSGPAGPFGSLSHKPRGFKGNAKTFSGRRQQSRERYGC